MGHVLYIIESIQKVLRLSEVVGVAELALSLPQKRTSAWTTETDPKYARAWLAALPLADSAESAREIYQSLYTLNRLELDAPRRFELMEIYRGPVATVVGSLESYFFRLALPLTPKKRQLAEFIRQLHMEMAYGYKAALRDLPSSRLWWGKKSLLTQIMARAMQYLGEVLMRSYQIYMPYPAGVWKEIHDLYRYAEAREIHHEISGAANGDSGAETSIAQDYLRILLLGLSNPYHMPQDECRQLQRFLQKWATKATLQNPGETANPMSHFLIEATDAPPIPFPRDIQMPVGPEKRLLDVSDLTRIVNAFIARLQRGESAQSMDIGVDCLDSACLEMLQRVVRIWGQSMQRRHTRIKRTGYVFLCAGIGAVHFFSNGQKPFVAPVSSDSSVPLDDRVMLPDHMDEDEAFIPLDEPVPAQPSSASTENIMAASEAFRMDRWQIRDSGPKGLFLVRYGSIQTSVRVGDLVGVQRTDDLERWNVGVVRWMKSPDASSLQMGVELLAPSVQPVSIRPGNGDNASATVYSVGLLLPAMQVPPQPVTLLVPRGACQLGRDVWLVQENIPARLIRPLQRLQQTGSVELFVYADVMQEPAGA
jgi:hypothetical protein